MSNVTKVAIWANGVPLGFGDSVKAGDYISVVAEVDVRERGAYNFIIFVAAEQVGVVEQVLEIGVWGIPLLDWLEKRVPEEYAVVVQMYKIEYEAASYLGQATGGYAVTAGARTPPPTGKNEYILEIGFLKAPWFDSQKFLYFIQTNLASLVNPFTEPFGYQMMGQAVLEEDKIKIKFLGASPGIPLLAIAGALLGVALAAGALINSIAWYKGAVAEETYAATSAKEQELVEKMYSDGKLTTDQYVEVKKLQVEAKKKEEKKDEAFGFALPWDAGAPVLNRVVGGLGLLVGVGVGGYIALKLVTPDPLKSITKLMHLKAIKELGAKA